MEKIYATASEFKLDAEVAAVTPLGEGFINDTYIITTKGGPRYILQRKNHNVFPDVPAMMDNIVAVTTHIKKKVKDPLRETLTVIDAKDGRHYFKDEDGCFWAVCLFIEGTVTHDIASTLSLARQGGMGIGHFQSLLSDFTAPLSEVIKGFHDIEWRFKQWDESLDKDAASRKKDLGKEIAFIEERRDKMMDFRILLKNGTLPSGIAHNDTKLSNFLFDEASGKVLCAIDLDTVMRSTPLYDVGDAIRSYANATVEDDPDCGKVDLRLDVFEAYMDGYLSERASTLTASEKEWLAFAPLYITYEQVLRFLMDYIDGDKYYKIKYPEHNLVRTRSQIALLKSMEAKYPKMQELLHL